MMSEATKKSAAPLVILPAVLTPAPAPVEPSEGLIGHWNFDSLADGAGLARDASGHGNDGTIAGTPRVIAGKLGKGLRFRDLEDQVIFPDLGIAAPATLLFWFHTRELVNDRVVWTQHSGAETLAGALRFSGLELQVWSGSQWRAVIVRQLRFDAWQHAAVVFSAAGEATGFLNGKKQQSVQSSFDFKGVGAAIGGRHLGRHHYPYIGSLDDVRLYGQALSAERIAGIYQAAAL